MQYMRLSSRRKAQGPFVLLSEALRTDGPSGANRPHTCSRPTAVLGQGGLLLGRPQGGTHDRVNTPRRGEKVSRAWSARAYISYSWPSCLLSQQGRRAHRACLWCRLHQPWAHCRCCFCWYWWLQLTIRRCILRSTCRTDVDALRGQLPTAIDDCVEARLESLQLRVQHNPPGRTKLLSPCVLSPHRHSAVLGSGGGVVIIVPQEAVAIKEGTDARASLRGRPMDCVHHPCNEYEEELRLLARDEKEEAHNLYPGGGGGTY